MLRSLGGKRSRTVRQRVLVWRKVRLWLLRSYGCCWPQSSAQLIDYLEARAQEPCGKTVPQSILSALSFIESCADVDRNARLSQRTEMQATVDSLTAELGVGRPPVQRAWPMPIVFLVALELYVVSDRELYKRALAWVKLVKVWTGMRFDDTLGVVPSTFHWGPKGLQAKLERTKTSGPGKRVGWLPIFVSVDAYLVEPRWLEVGREIWASEGFNFSRDYLLPLPSEDLSSCRKVLADYADVTALMRQLFRELRYPSRLYEVDGSSTWMESEEAMVPSELVGFWTEHGDRRMINSLAAELGVSKTERDFLGRWVPQQSDDYLATAKSVVMGVQSKVAKGLRRKTQSFGESQLFVEIKNRLCLTWDALGEEQYIETLMFRAQVEDDPSDESGLEECAEHLEVQRAEQRFVPDAPEPPAEVFGTPPEGFPYYISFSKKCKFARLHLVGGCHRRPGV